jgi:starch synthase (maltosyl-transferring)
MIELPAVRPSRVVVENVRPAVEAGLGAKGSLGAPFVVRADVFGDGHDRVAAALHYRTAVAEPWTEVPMRPLGNDRWEAAIDPKRLGHMEYEIIGWSDHYETWRDGTTKKVEAALDVSVELEEGARLLTEAADRAAADADRTALKEAAARLRAGTTTAVLDDSEVSAAMWRSADRRPLVTTPPFHAFVEPERARFSAWYELFPRSTVDGTDGHAKLRDVITRLPTSRPWASTSSTCRRSTRSDGRDARARTTRRRRVGPTTSAAPGPSARPRGATPPSTPTWARSRTCRRSSPPLRSGA